MTRRLYSSASSRACSVGSASSTGSASTQSAAPGPGRRSRSAPGAPARSTAAGAPPGSRPTCSIVATHAVGRVAVGEPRGEQQLARRAGLGGVDDGLGRVVELDRHDHAGQHDEVGHGQDGELGGGQVATFGGDLSGTDSTLGSHPLFRCSSANTSPTRG